MGRFDSDTPPPKRYFEENKTGRIEAAKFDQIELANSSEMNENRGSVRAVRGVASEERPRIFTRPPGYLRHHHFNVTVLSFEAS